MTLTGTHALIQYAQQKDNVLHPYDSHNYGRTTAMAMCVLRHQAYYGYGYGRATPMAMATGVLRLWLRVQG